MRKTHAGLAALMAGTVLFSTAEAQRRPAQPPAPPVAPAPDRTPGQGPRIGGPGAGGPAAQLLRMREQLQLTEDQVKRLEALQNAPAPTPNASAMLRAQADLMDAMRGDGNIEAARAALTKASQVRNDRVLAQLKQRQEARAVLTAQQKQMVDNAMARRGQGMRQQGMRQQGMRGMRGGQPFGGRGPQGVGPGRQLGPGFGPGMGPGQGRPPVPQGPLPRQRRGDDPETDIMELHQLGNW